MTALMESEINTVSTHARLEGKIQLEKITRVFGTLVGTVECATGSELILMETSVVEGNISGDVVVIEGYVKGDIDAKTKITIAPNGRVIGNLRAASIAIAFGAFFEGKCQMQASP